MTNPIDRELRALEDALAALEHITNHIVIESEAQAAPIKSRLIRSSDRLRRLTTAFSPED